MNLGYADMEDRLPPREVKKPAEPAKKKDEDVWDIPTFLRKRKR
jgi:hypothetical protein